MFTHAPSTVGSEVGHGQLGLPVGAVIIDIFFFFVPWERGIVRCIDGRRQQAAAGCEAAPGVEVGFLFGHHPPKHDPDASGCGSSSVPQKSHGDSYPNGLAKTKNDGGDSNFCTSERFQAIKNILQRQKERRLAMAAKKDDDDGRAKSGPNLSTDNPHVLPPFVSQLTLDLSIFLGNVSTQ